MWATEEFPDITFADIFDVTFGAWRLLGFMIGAVIAIAVITFVFKKKYKIPHNKTMTAFLEGAFLAFAFGKFACFLEGCCYGIETTLPWGMDFGDGILRHPTQLYETACLLAIVVIVCLLRNKLSTPQRYCLAIFIYVVTRMMIEPIRDEAAIFIDGPTRIIYYILLVVCVVILFKDKILKLIKKDNKMQETK